MADFFKGLAGGFGTGLQFGQAMRERDMRDALAQESSRYGVTEGAYGPGLQENIQQLQGLREQDPTQAPAYDQAIAELTRRQGLTAPDYSVASGPTNFATRQEARQAAAPMRTEGLAGVYRQYGDVAQADALEARAFEQQRGIAREGREVQDFATRQAAAAQQAQLTGAKLTDIQRTQNLQAALDARLADINKQEFEKPEMRTQAILGLVEELQGPQAAAQLRANYTQQELNDISLQSKKFEEGYRQSRAKGVFAAMDWFDEQNAAFKLERDPKNPFRVIQVNQDGSRQLFADAKNERELGMVIDAKAKPGGFLELAKYDLDLRKGEAAIEASRASTAKDRALGGLYAQGGAGKQSATESLVNQAKRLVEDGTYKDTATAIEALKRGSARDADRDAWLKSEQKLIEADTPPETIEAQRTAFFVRRGYAPAAARQVLEAGVNPATGKPLTRSDVDAYNATYPQTPVDPGSLPWLPSPEREARRQGLISQIPK